MKKLMMCGVLAMCGLFACVTEPAPTPDPETSSEVSASTGGTCFIDYTCPTDGFETTGFKSGGTGPGPALRTCNTHCAPVLCQAGQWTCL